MDAETQAAVQQLNNTINQASGMAFNASESKKARAWQENMWKKTYDQQLQDNLRYNTPSAQVARLKAAGLNTNLMYGSGVGSQPFSFGGTSGSPSSASAPNMYYQDPLAMSQVKVNEAQAENIKADTAKKQSETTGIDIQNDINRVTLENLDDMQKSEINKNQEEAKKLGSETNLNVKRLDEVAANTYKIMKDAGKSEAEANYIAEQTRFVSFYAYLEGKKVDFEGMRVQLEAIGLQLTGEGLKLDAQRVKLEGQKVLLNGVQLSIEEYKARCLAELQKAQGYFFQRQGDKVTHDIAQGYWNCINGSINSITNLMGTMKGSGSNSYWSQYMSK